MTRPTAGAESDPGPAPARRIRWSRALGPALAGVMLVMPTGGLAGDAKLVAAVIVWMAAWWVTEAVPLAITALLPLVLLPLLGVRGVREVAPNYSNHMIFLFFGGFVLARAVERCGLHRRLALAILALVGPSPRRQVWGFALATAVLSMWLSNTATALMMLPIAIGVAGRLDDPRAPARLMLAVAYGASVGGVGTLVGTPPNLVLAGMATRLAEVPAISFGGWLLFGLPFVAVALPVVCLRLTRGLSGRLEDDLGLAEERRALGPPSSAERRVAVLFVVTALAWITRARLEIGGLVIPGWSDLLPNPSLVSDAVPAVAAAILTTLVPSGEGRPLLSWNEIRSGVPWGILLLFGGGFALADGVRASALDGWLAQALHGLAALPLPVVVLAVCLIVTFATELTSNTATATLLLPVMAAVATVLEVPPYLLMVPAVVSASCAFMLPVATPPNAIVIGSGQLPARRMAAEGVWLNVAMACITTALVLTVGRVVLPLG